MDAAPYETDAIVVAELCIDREADELATVPFRLPAPPQPGLALVLVAGFVIAVYGFAAGYCVATILLSDNGGNIIVAMLGLVFCVAVVWSQLIAVFRPHGERANFAGNVLIGSAAMIAAALTGFPMIAGQPIVLSQLLGYGGLTIFLAIAGHLNLVWSRQLRSVGWIAPRGWTFSLRELLAIFTAVAVACGGYMLCTRLARETEFRRQQVHEIWRMQRISDAQQRRSVAPAPIKSSENESEHE